ncbi:TonB-dependent receptor [Herbaspirillum sp. BH-1]|uniref:Iron complex outermembrane receptor protein n=1 Tax=Herbaspirillum frisingense TaxID=92645 RepID=A0ABU1P9H0_9BURK|nr:MULTISPECIES: TonB-dependent receptor [Herbaspirillum]MDR6582566.1 iron complex outermembrane receptor protein [Herbaspirillum frisingense]PLY59731.1 TonB-dependent receptor [Herbaspirillum sp. BH-1]
MKTRKTVLAAACAALAGSAMAQANPTTPATALHPVTVTANKVEETLLAVPQSVTVVTGDDLQERGIRNVADLVREVPNLSSRFVYSNDLNFRGINSSTFTNANPMVMIIDGIPQSNRIAYDALLDNVERVEILRGPQGSLYGKDAIGGVINVVSKTPTNTWTGQGGIEAGSLGSRELGLSASGPLIKDALFLTLGVKAAQTDGWISNRYPGMDAHANRADEQRLRLGLLYRLSAATQLRLNLSGDDQNNRGADGGLVPFGSDYRSLTRDAARQASFDQPTYTRTRTNAQSLALQHQFDTLRLDAVLTRKSIAMDGDYDVDWGSGNPLYDGLNQFLHLGIDSTTQELRLSAGNPGQLRWLGGLYFEQEKSRNTRYGMQYPGALMGMPGVNLDMDAPSATRSGTQAAFGQIMAPLTPDLELTLGGRYQHIRKHFDVAMTMQPVGTHGAPPAIAIHDASHTWTAFLPKAALSYRLNAQWTSFASVARGYLPGGYNYWPSSAREQDNRFGPQRSTNYELGMRTDSGRLSLAATLFHMDIKDIHVYSFDRSSGMIQTSNGGQGKSQGVELEAGLQLSSLWQANASLGLVRATYDDYAGRADNGAVVKPGNRIEKTPAHTLTVGLQYGAGTGFYARGDVRGQGRRYFNPENTTRDGAFVTVDLKGGYQTGPWDLYAYVRNLTDAEYRTSVNPQGSGSLVTFGEPRRLGVGARYRF